MPSLNNSLLKHLTDTRLSPSKITLDYMDNKSLTNFFASCKKSYPFPLALQLTSIRDFLNDLTKEIEAKSFFTPKKQKILVESSHCILFLGLSLMGHFNKEIINSVRQHSKINDELLCLAIASFTAIISNFGILINTHMEEKANLTLLDCSENLQEQGDQLFLKLSSINGINPCTLTASSRIEDIKNYLSNLIKNRALPVINDNDDQKEREYPNCRMTKAYN